MKRILLPIAFLLGILACNAQSPSRPNIIIIFMDDMGYGDTEPYGMTGIPTPNFNRLAREGMRFTHFNSAQAVCTASRAALLTGCYPNRLGMTGALPPGAKKALNQQEETIATILKKAGYKTAMLGKWHLGNKPPYSPIHFGFDSYYGLPYSHDMWPMDYDGKHITDSANIRFTWPVLPIYQNDTRIDSITSLQDQTKLTTAYTQRAVDFIKTNKKGPFFLYLAHSMPHVPLAASARFRGKSELGLFGDVIMEIDWSIGEVLKTLDQEKIAANTLVIVTSDNGPWLNFGEHAGSSGGFREGKSTSWEGGTRVPLLVRWPGKVEAASINSQLMINMDILPTVAAAAGASLPAKKIDGMNFLPLWLGKTSNGPREVFYYYFGNNNLEGVRYRHWKLVLAHPTSTYAALHGKDGKPGVTSRVDVPMALYDLSHDPGEAYDVQKLYPEIVQKLLVMADDAREDMGDDLTNRKGANMRPPAVVE